MKTSYKKILVLAMAVTALTAFAAYGAKEKDEEDFWRANEPNRAHRWFELTDEGTEHIMERLAESKPEKAKELAELREKDPDKFKAELRKVMREHFRKKCRKHREQRLERTMPSAPGERDMKRGRKRKLRKDMADRHQWKRHAEYFEWLKKNYLKEAERYFELTKLKGKDPEHHKRMLAMHDKKYRRIFEMEKENPQLAQVFKEDLKLKKKRDKLLRKIKVEVDEDKKQELVEELREVISGRFDLILRRKQIEYKQLRKRLERLEKKVKRNEIESEKWKESKSAKVTERLEELVNETEKFDWH